MRALAPQLKRFLARESGTITVEFVLVLPFLIWAYLALFVFWDAYRTINLAQKASYTVADYLSRERDTLTANEIGGLRKTFEFMTATSGDVKMRFTSIYFNITKGRFEVYWSRSPDGTMTQLTTASLQAFTDRIPAMADGDSAILVETELSYTPAFDVGITPASYQNFVVTRPRFLTRICLEGVTC